MTNLDQISSNFGLKKTWT